MFTTVLTFTDLVMSLFVASASASTQTKAGYGSWA